MSRRKATLLALLFLLLPTAICAQEAADKNPPGPTATEKKALDLLDSIASRIGTFHNPENRIAISAIVADLIWSHDEKRARTLFENVTREEAALVSALDLSNPRAFESLSSINNQRLELVGRMASHDPEMALAFLHATRFPSTAPGQFAAGWERNLELTLARTISQNDPDRAVKIARDSLSKGLSYEVVNLLIELNRKSPGAAKSLYESLVARIKMDDLSRSQEAGNLAVNLLNALQPPNVDEDLFRDLLETVIKAALSLSPGDFGGQGLAQNYLGNLSSSLGMIEKYAPSRVAAIRDWAQTVRRTMDPASQLYAELNETTQRGTVDDILALATKFPPDTRNQVYQQAVWKASNDGDVTRARQIAADYVTDPMMRRQILAQIDEQSTWKAINENKLTEARALLARTGSVDQRIQLLYRMVSALLRKDNKKEALECLGEARGLINEMPRGSARTWQQMQLAGIYSPVDFDQSIGLMQTVIQQINEVVSAAVVMDGFENHYLRHGEWIINVPNSVGNLVTNMETTVAQLARADFDRVLSLSDQIERPEIRLLTQLQIAEAVLKGPSSNRLVSPRMFTTMEGA